MAAPAAVDTAVDSPCTISGYGTDPDPSGTNIRAAPRAEAPIVGHLPSPRQMPKDDPNAQAAEFEIIGARNGWLLIRQARIGLYTDGKAMTVFEGPGWISGALAGFTIGSNELRTGPATDAPVIARLMGDNWGPDSYAVRRVHACRGHFAEVTITRLPGGKPMRGWVGKVCSNQVTTCDPE